MLRAVLVALPLPIFLQALAVALGVALVAGWVARFFTGGNRGEDGREDQ